jgi:hypothetical protein
MNGDSMLLPAMLSTAALLASTLTTTPGNKAPLAVGAKPNGEDPFTGELDYVRIWLD